MNKRFTVLVLDGFGIGATRDTKAVRPRDENSNTLRSILEDFPNLSLPNLEKLGLMNSFGSESQKMKFNSDAVFGKSELVHFGADTFMGHQEIMGSYPKKPDFQPFQDKIDAVITHLTDLSYKVEVIQRGKLRYLLINDYCTVADNIDTDLGLAVNCTAPLDFMSYDELYAIGKRVREIVTVNRVIVFGGTNTTLDDLLAAEETYGEYIGINAAKSKSYNQGLIVRHLGYGVDENVQAPTILTRNGINVSLFGKVADIVINDNGKSVSCVDTAEVLDLTIEEIKNLKNGFICTNVQETDLSGHSQNSQKYKQILEVADHKIGVIMELLQPEDVLVVMADHGNDPNIGHNLHTRENVPLLIQHNNLKGINIGLRESLADVGASVCDFFGVNSPQFGESFINKLK